MFLGIVLFSIGIGWVLQYYGIIPQDVEFFWPFVFIAGGISLILSSLKPRRWRSWCGEFFNDQWHDRSHTGQEPRNENEELTRV